MSSSSSSSSSPDSETAPVVSGSVSLNPKDEAATPSSPCPCQSGTVYSACCEPYHRGKQPASTALALMRSRYSAYALSQVDYILNTTHRENSQFRRNLKAWRLEVADYCKRTKFLALTILDNIDVNEQIATVTFQATLLQEGNPYQLNEKSLFYKVGARWLYHSGTYDEAEAEPRAANGETDAFPRQDG